VIGRGATARDNESGSNYDFHCVKFAASCTLRIATDAGEKLIDSTRADDENGDAKTTIDMKR